MPSIDSSIQWYEERKGKVTYSMVERRGPTSYDCSSSLYYALIQGGFFPVGIYIGNTDSLFSDLERNGWVQLQPNAQGNYDTQRGDVFIWGIRGNSNGALGHTGAFEDADNIIHCSYGYNGIAVSNYDWLHSINGNPPQTFYRYQGGAATPNSPTDQVVQPGSYIKFDRTFTVNDVQDISDVWQVKTDELCPSGFTWADNGIPAAPLVEVDSDGYATPDQELNVGSLYRLPGKFQVLDVGPSGNSWLGQIESVGLKFWVDLGPVTEVSQDDPGTPAPTARPVETPPTFPVPSPEPPTTDVPSTPVEPTPAPVEPTTPVVTNPTPVEPPVTTPSTPTKSFWQLLWELILGFFGVKL